MSIARIEPIPTKDQYDHVYETASEALLLYGGIRSHLANRALQVKFDQSIAQQDLAVSALGVRFVDETLQGDEDACYEAAFAFTNGFMVANDIVDKLYQSPHTVHDRLTPAIDWLSQVPIEDTTDSEERMRREMRYLTEFGIYGTRQLGGVALAHLAEWSNQAYPGYQRSAMMFCLGAGTVVAGAQMHQGRLNAQLIHLMDTGEIHYDDFLKQTTQSSEDS